MEYTKEGLYTPPFLWAPMKPLPTFGQTGPAEATRLKPKLACRRARSSSSALKSACAGEPVTSKHSNYLKE